MPEFSDAIWTDCGNSVLLQTPAEFSFTEILCFLKRTENDPLHQVRGGAVTKAVRLSEGPVLIRVSADGTQLLRIDFLERIPSNTGKREVALYVWEWLDMDIDLGSFYCLEDPVVQELIQRYAGLRVICILDLFEALAWAIMGQQINIQFAYMLQKNFVEAFGESIEHAGQVYWLFPRPERVTRVSVEEMKTLKFTGRKAEYIIGIARLLAEGEVSRSQLCECANMAEMEQELLKIRGVGKWTAQYVLLKCLKQREAFPVQDVGVQNALKNLLRRQEKPTVEEILGLARGWRGFERYVTFYLWRSLV